MRDGCVFKTQPNGYAWITFGMNTIPGKPHIILGSLPTDMSAKLPINKLYRTVADDAPDVVYDPNLE